MTLPVWLEEPVQQLFSVRDQNRLPHAVLLQGVGGWGETQLTSYLALKLIDKPTGTFLSMEAETVAHPDLHWVQSEKPGGQISIDQIRSLAAYMVQSVQIAARKVAVILHAENMNQHAANALLKTLEEPPPDSLLILMTTSPAELLPTIRSRCQTLSLKPGTRDEASNWLKNHFDDLDHSAVNSLLFEYGGAPFQVLSALEQKEAPLLLTLQHILKRPDQVEAVVENWLKLDLDLLLCRWMRYVAELQRAHVQGEVAGFFKDLAPITGHLNPDGLHKFWQELVWTRKLIHSTSNPNVSLLLEKLLLHWCALGHTRTAA